MFNVGLAVIAAGLAVVLLGWLSSLYRHSSINGIDIYTFSLPIKLVLVGALIMWWIFSVTLLIPNTKNSVLDYIIALGIEVLIIWFIIFVLRMRISLDKEYLNYRGIFNHVVPLSTITKIIVRNGARNRQAFVYTDKRKKLWLSGYLTDFDDLIYNLRRNCPNSVDDDR